MVSNNGENLLTALISGSTATAVTSTITYPLDFIKTQQQINNYQLMKNYNIPGNYPNSIAQVFCGSSALILGNVAKNQARLISYNWATKFMSLENHHGDTLKTSAPRMVIAGAMSAFIETLFIIPFENIKITMIQNMTLHNEIGRSRAEGLPDVTGAVVHQKHHKPHQSVFLKQYVSPNAYFPSDLVQQYKSGKPFLKTTTGGGHHPVGNGDCNEPSSSRLSKTDKLKRKFNKAPSLSFLATVNEIYRLKGIHGFTAGTFITMTRQVAISTVWLSTYNAARQLLDPHGNSSSPAGSSEQLWFGHKHTALQLIGLHLFSSIAVVVVTQPLDVVKTHIQLKNGKVIYKDSLSTAYKLCMRQGFTKLWSGSVPRGLKIFTSGGLTATLYSYIEGAVNVAGGQRVFAAE